MEKQLAFRKNKEGIIPHDIVYRVNGATIRGDYL